METTIDFNEKKGDVVLQFRVSLSKSSKTEIRRPYKPSENMTNLLWHVKKRVKSEFFFFLMKK